MSKAFRQFRFCLFCTVFLTLATAILRSIALVFTFDDRIGYFAADSVLPTLIYIMVGISLFLAFFLFTRLPKNALAASAGVPPTAELVCSGVTALMAMAVSLTLIFNVATLKTPPLLTLLAFLLFFVASGYFFLAFLAQKQLLIRVTLGYAVILAAALLLAVTYFDLDTPMNSPRKTSLHLCLLSIMLYMLYELRVLIGRPLPRVQGAVASICFFFCGAMGLSNTVGFVAGAHDSVLYLVCDLFCLAFAFYVGTHTLSTQIVETQEEE